MLTFAVAAELTGPFIAKKVIDEHMRGIESPWIEVEAKDDQTVEYKWAFL